MLAARLTSWMTTTPSCAKVTSSTTGIVVLQDVGRAADIGGFAFDFEGVVEQMGLHAQSGFDQPDVFVAGSKEAFYASADADAGFHQVGVGYLQAGEKRRQGLPQYREGFEASTTRWHGLQNTIRHYYTPASQARAQGWVNGFGKRLRRTRPIGGGDSGQRSGRNRNMPEIRCLSPA